MKKKSNRKSNRKSKTNNKKFTKTINDFKKTKSISIISTMTDLKKKSTVGELYDVDELKKIMSNRCINIVNKKEVDGVNMKKISKDICNCLFKKNKDLSLQELEERMKHKNETPGSECIKIVDNYVLKNKKVKNKSSSKK
jgi:hypothetical protein